MSSSKVRLSSRERPGLEWSERRLVLRQNYIRWLSFFKFQRLFLWSWITDSLMLLPCLREGSSCNWLWLAQYDSFQQDFLGQQVGFSPKSPYLALLGGRTQLYFLAFRLDLWQVLDESLVFSSTLLQIFDPHWQTPSRALLLLFTSFIKLLQGPYLLQLVKLAFSSKKDALKGDLFLSYAFSPPRELPSFSKALSRSTASLDSSNLTAFSQDCTNYLLLHVCCFSLILVNTPPKINLKSSGMPSVSQLDRLSFPVCDLSSRLNSASRAAEYSQVGVGGLTGSTFIELLLSKGIVGMCLALLCYLRVFSSLVLRVLALGVAERRLAMETSEQSFAFYLLAICQTYEILSWYKTLLSLSFISSSRLQGRLSAISRWYSEISGTAKEAFAFWFFFIEPGRLSFLARLVSAWVFWISARTCVSSLVIFLVEYSLANSLPSCLAYLGEDCWVRASLSSFLRSWRQFILKLNFMSLAGTGRGAGGTSSKRPELQTFSLSSANFSSQLISLVSMRLFWLSRTAEQSGRLRENRLLRGGSSSLQLSRWNRCSSYSQAGFCLIAGNFNNKINNDNPASISTAASCYTLNWRAVMASGFWPKLQLYQQACQSPRRASRSRPRGRCPTPSRSTRA